MPGKSWSGRKNSRQMRWNCSSGFPWGDGISTNNVFLLPPDFLSFFSTGKWCGNFMICSTFCFLSPLPVLEVNQCIYFVKKRMFRQYLNYYHVLKKLSYFGYCLYNSWPFLFCDLDSRALKYVPVFYGNKFTCSRIRFPMSIMSRLLWRTWDLNSGNQTCQFGDLKRKSRRERKRMREGETEKER